MKFHVIAKNRATGRSYVFCGMGARQWFSDVRPNCAERTFSYGEAYSTRETLEQQCAIHVIDKGNYDARRYSYHLENAKERP